MVPVKIFVGNFKNPACSVTNASPERRAELPKFVWKLKVKGIKNFIN